MGFSFKNKENKIFLKNPRKMLPFEQFREQTLIIFENSYSIGADLAFS